MRGELETLLVVCMGVPREALSSRRTLQFEQPGFRCISRSPSLSRREGGLFFDKGRSPNDE
jgi:hypothetical protein